MNQINRDINFNITKNIVLDKIKITSLFYQYVFNARHCLKQWLEEKTNQKFSFPHAVYVLEENIYHVVMNTFKKSKLAYKETKFQTGNSNFKDPEMEGCLAYSVTSNRPGWLECYWQVHIIDEFRIVMQECLFVFCHFKDLSLT